MDGAFDSTDCQLKCTHSLKRWPSKFESKEEGERGHLFHFIQIKEGKSNDKQY